MELGDFSEGGKALSVIATEHSVDMLCGFPVVEFAGHVVECVLDEREVCFLLRGPAESRSKDGSNDR